MSTFMTGTKKYNEFLSKTTDTLHESSNKLLRKGTDLIHGASGEEVTKGLNLEDKTCLITGGNCGIGLEIVRCLVSRNCDVMMACRNPYAALSVTNNLRDKDSRQLRIYEANLASFASVKACCNKILKDQKEIDIVILNAAVFGLPYTITLDGIETIFQVNYLSQYYMLMSIEKILAPEARVIWMSSESHRNISWKPENIIAPTEDLLSLPERSYTSIKAYNVSKLCGLLCMHYLGYRWAKTGKSIFCASPGSFVKTRLCRNWWVYETLYNTMRPFSKPITHAAATPLYCATSPALNGLSALYYKDCRQCEESNMAKDFHLAIKINEITKAIIQDRLVSLGDAVEETQKVKYDEQKHAIEEPLITN